MLHNKRGPVYETAFKTNKVVHHVAGGPFMPSHSYVVNTGPSAYEDRIAVNEFDMEQFIRYSTKWDDMYVRSNSQVEDVKERITRFLANFNGIHDADVYRGGGKGLMTYFPWEDFEIF